MQLPVLPGQQDDYGRMHLLRRAEACPPSSCLGLASDDVPARGCIIHASDDSKLEYPILASSI